MATIKRRSKAVWLGSGLQGTGKLDSTSGVLQDTPYSFATRFTSEDGKAGTNPEELIAAAHAGCFSMALSFQIDGAGFTATSISTEATLTMEGDAGGFSITQILLTTHAVIPGITEAKFKELADTAKANCPVSKALSSVSIHLDAQLDQA
jgi:osmotically inducible protein OsmC